MPLLVLTHFELIRTYAKHGQQHSDITTSTSLSGKGALPHPTKLSTPMNASMLGAPETTTVPNADLFNSDGWDQEVLSASASAMTTLPIPTHCALPNGNEVSVSRTFRPIPKPSFDDFVRDLVANPDEARKSKMQLNRRQLLRNLEIANAKSIELKSPLGLLSNSTDNCSSTESKQLGNKIEYQIAAFESVDNSPGKSHKENSRGTSTTPSPMKKRRTC
eukprot:Filipodium_phascolosomae@DN7149_c0_g1_i1.p1